MWLNEVLTTGGRLRFRIILALIGLLTQASTAGASTLSLAWGMFGRLAMAVMATYNF